MTETSKLEQAASPRRIFAFLLFYRWFSLSIPWVAFLFEPDETLLLALAAATAVNTFISFFPIQLNQTLRQRPWLLTADMVVMAALVALTGGWQTPFYFYSLNPLLIAAFFFGLRGALTAVSTFLPLYAGALIIAAAQTAESFNWLLVVTAVVGYYLISGTFGFAAGLLGSLRLAQVTAEQVRAEIRHSILDIWPSELTAERFTADLQKYVEDTCHVGDLQLAFDVRGEFSRLSSQARRSLYRISQESLANVARHAAATEAHVCVDIGQGRARLVVRDNGRGFEPAAALKREYGREHFGLRGIQQRTQSLGGECHIFSQPGEGTSIIGDIPING